MKQITVVFFSLITTCLAFESAKSDPAVKNYVSKPAAPLFSSDTTLQIKVRTDFSNLIGRGYGEGTNKLERKFQAVDLELIGPEADVFPAVTVAQVSGRGELRGNFCTFPQLKIDFGKRPRGKSLFRGLKELKMVTHCGVNVTGRDIELNESVRMEYLVYRLRQAASDLSFNARLALVTYEDTSGTLDSFQSYAIFVEDIGDLARRFSVKRVYNPEQVAARPELEDSLLSKADQVDLLRRAQLHFFQVMIGNDDYYWGHNLKGISGPFGFDLIPYDFDYAKIFAFPQHGDGLRLDSPRFLTCLSSDELKAILAELFQKRQQITRVVAETKLIDGQAKEMALNSLSRFFNNLNTVDFPDRDRPVLNCPKYK